MPGLDVSVIVVALVCAAIDPFRVVVIPDDAPVMVTLLLVEYIPCSLCDTCITVEAFVSLNGFGCSLLPYTVVLPSSDVTASPIKSLVKGKL